jgi:NAD(P)-dependent dehydrogenase (short-subunit alcohol dehydrogenase family)
MGLATAKALTKTGASNDLPVQRVGRSEEIAEAVLFLISNGYVTGTVLDIDGGARLG